MNVLPAWERSLSEAGAPIQTENLFAVPRSPAHYAGAINVVRTGAEAEALLQLAMERNLSHAGFDSEYRFAAPPVICGKKERFDIRSVEPLLLSLALVEPAPQGDILYRFVIDLYDPAVRPALAELFRLPLPFAAFFAKGDLFCLWQMGLPEPAQLWDGWVAEKALCLGQEHVKYKAPAKDDVGAQIAAKEETEASERLRYSLVDTCRRYGVALAGAEHKDRLQRSFLDHIRGEPFTEEQISYAAEDAVAAARLYPLQVMGATRSGLLSHLINAEMPWTVTSARMEWTGLLIDRDLADRVRADGMDRLPGLERQLNDLGLANANSNPQVRQFFADLGLLHLFAGRDGEAFEKKLLRRHAGAHPAIPLIAEVRQLRSVLADGMLDPSLVGVDGRVHPELRQLGTHTGRQTSKHPNALGLPGSLRPLVIAREGYGIGEADLCQIEVGVTAAVYGDDTLVRLYNSGDVYAAMAKLFYDSELSEADLALGGPAFKRAHPGKRGAMKTATLAMIYGTGPEGLASQLGIGVPQARALLKKFLGMFPALARAKSRGANCSVRRGYAAAVSGLRRHRGRDGAASGWERRWLVNFPVQGSAAVAFKVAGNRLDRLFRAYDARLLLPVHDCFVFEAPLSVLPEVAELTSQVLCEAVQEYFPQLRPKGEINIARAECWNKEG